LFKGIDSVLGLVGDEIDGDVGSSGKSTSSKVYPSFTSRSCSLGDSIEFSFEESIRISLGGSLGDCFGVSLGESLEVSFLMELFGFGFSKVSTYDPVMGLGLVGLEPESDELTEPDE